MTVGQTEEHNCLKIYHFLSLFLLCLSLSLPLSVQFIIVMYGTHMWHEAVGGISIHQ